MSTNHLDRHDNINGGKNMNIFGFFDDKNQTTPALDPGLNVLCPVCMSKLEKPIRTFSVMKLGSNKSYFYRVHKECSNNINAIEDIESSLVDSAEG